MNRALLNPFEALKLPDNLELYMDTDVGKATCMAFNRHGNVLAVGLSTGHIALWDFDTRCNERAPAHYVGGSSPPQQNILPGHHVTAVAFPTPRIGERIMASFAAAAPAPPPGSGPLPGTGSSLARQAVAGRNGVVSSEHGTGVLRLCETLDGRVLTEIEFDMPIVHFVPHPSRADVLVALPANMYPLLITIAPGRYRVTKSVFNAPVGPDVVHAFAPHSPPPPSGAAPVAAASTSPPPVVTVAVLHRQDAAPGDPWPSPVLPNHLPGSGNGRRGGRAVLDPYAVAFARDGRKLLRGGPDGVIQVFEFAPPVGDATVKPRRPEVVLGSSFKVAGGAAIRSLTLMKGKLLVNSADRSLRLFETAALAPPPPGPDAADGALFAPPVKTTFTEAVNRSQAKCACFSRDGDFVLAGMLGSDAHRIVVWRASDGHPETTLEGPTEGILDLLWHPVQPVIASIGAQYGGVYVWAKNFTENWSAFAPEFTELEANEEYSENEGEFDAKHPSSDERVKREREAAEEKTIVDVEAPFCFSSDDEEAATSGAAGTRAPAPPSGHKRFFHLPAIPERDSKFSYPTTTKDGRKARDVVKANRAAKRQREHDGVGAGQGQADAPVPGAAAPVEVGAGGHGGGEVEANSAPQKRRGARPPAAGQAAPVERQSLSSPAPGGDVGQRSPAGNGDAVRRSLDQHHLSVPDTGRTEALNVHGADKARPDAQRSAHGSGLE